MREEKELAAAPGGFRQFREQRSRRAAGSGRNMAGFDTDDGIDQFISENAVKD